jgi:hypothetical protein
VLAKQAPVECSKGGGAPSPPTAPKAKQAEPFNKQESLVPGWNHIVLGGRVVKATLPAIPHPTPDPVTENPMRKEVTTTSKKDKTAKSAPRVKVGPKQAPVTKLNKPAKPGKTSQPKSK